MVHFVTPNFVILNAVKDLCTPRRPLGCRRNAEVLRPRKKGLRMTPRLRIATRVGRMKPMPGARRRFLLLLVRRDDSGDCYHALPCAVYLHPGVDGALAMSERLSFFDALDAEDADGHGAVSVHL